jgi:hypothetical protein
MSGTNRKPIRNNLKAALHQLVKQSDKIAIISILTIILYHAQNPFIAQEIK